MCIFSGAVSRVSNTRIFVTELNNGQQFTVYQNAVSFAPGSNRVAMILPFPNPNGTVTPQTQIMWDMTQYKNFFVDCEKLFPEPVTRGASRSLGTPKSAQPRTLPIFSCGAYQYSVVANFADFSALNFTQFGLPPQSPSLLAQLQQYYGVGYGFLVCIYTAEGEIPPIAFIHPKLADKRLFVPTKHDHHGGNNNNSKTALADWDHDIYVLNNAASINNQDFFPLINGEYVNLSVKYTARGSDRWNELLQVFDYMRLPPGFPLGTAYPTPRAGPGSFVRMRVRGEQSNGDLAFYSARDFARCFEENQCTRTVTGNNYAYQPLYYCHTCWPTETNACLCHTCAVKHAKAGHKFSALDSLTGFCDSHLLK